MGKGRSPIPRVVALGPCAKCGVIHEYCSAHSRRTGLPCGRSAMRGGTVCMGHGAKSPQATAARSRVLAHDRALHEVGRRLEQAGVVLEGMTLAEQTMMGINHAGQMALSYRWLLDELPTRSQWSFVEPTRELVAEDGSKLTLPAEQGSPTRWVVVESEGLIGPDQHGNQKLHAYEEGFRFWTKLHGQLINDAVRLGLEERRQQFKETQVRAVGAAIRGIVEGLGRELDDPKVVPVVEAALRRITTESQVT